MVSGYVGLTTEEFRADVEAKHEKLFDFISKNLTEETGLNLRTLLYAMASLSGFYLALAPLESRVGLADEFTDVMAMSHRQAELDQAVSTDGPPN